MSATGGILGVLSGQESVKANVTVAIDLKSIALVGVVIFVAVISAVIIAKKV